MTDEAVKAAMEAMRDTAERRGVSEDTRRLLASDAVEGARPHIEAAARAEAARYRPALERIRDHHRDDPFTSCDWCGTFVNTYHYLSPDCPIEIAAAALDGEETP